MGKNSPIFIILIFPTKNSEKQVMDIIKGVTISEMAKELGLNRHTVENRLIRAGIKPLTYEALYPPDTLEKIREVSRGRPAKKSKDQEPPPKPPGKPSDKGL
jgi:hypothetical protein